MWCCAYESARTTSTWTTVAPVVQRPVSPTSDDASFSGLVSSSWRQRVLPDRLCKEARKGLAKALIACTLSVPLPDTYAEYNTGRTDPCKSTGVESRFVFAGGL